MKRCLINVDVQNDFITGSLALKNAPAGQDAEGLIPLINNLAHSDYFDLVVYSLDYHPPNHISFVNNYKLYSPSLHGSVNVGDNVLVQTTDGNFHQRLWPEHCIKNTKGAQLYPTLDCPLSAVYVYKGTLANVESYSVFGNASRGYDTGLHKLLQGFNVGHVFFTGVAEDICVGFSALDALLLGYKTTIIEDATCGACDKDCILMKQRVLKQGGAYLPSDALLN